MPAVSKKALLAPKVASTNPHDTYVTLPDGERVFIRPLSRDEAISVSELRERSGTAPAEHLLLHLGMVEPALALEEVEGWAAQVGSAADIEAVSRGIGVVSGMLPSSGKEAYKSA